jgi:hypothetical protein
VESKKLNPMDFMTAVTGNVGNKYAKDIIAKYSQNGGEAPNADTPTKSKYDDNMFNGFTSMSSFVQKVTDIPVSNYAELLDEFNKTKYSKSISGITELDLLVETSVPSGSYRSTMGCGLFPIGNNKYEVYEINYEAESYSFYSNRPLNKKIINYTLKTNKVLEIIDNKDVKVKPIKVKTIERVSYQKVADMNLKRIELTIDNEIKTLTF